MSWEVCSVCNAVNLLISYSLLNHIQFTSKFISCWGSTEYSYQTQETQHVLWTFKENSYEVCAAIFQMTACMDITPVTTTAAMIFLLLFVCWCIIVMVIVIVVITVFKNDQMKWKQSLRDMKSLSLFVLFLRFSLKKYNIGWKTICFWNVSYGAIP